jgi:GNAT superfamily N-acetyltransferase
MDELELDMPRCEFCDEKAQFRERSSGLYLCLQHARLEVVAPQRQAAIAPLELRLATPSDYPTIEAMCLYFWGETEFDCFDRQYDVLACPTILAYKDDRAVGMASYAIEEELKAMILVVLNVLPDSQGQGRGRALLDAVCDRARDHNLRRIQVVTSNDDLPALSLYQRYGFRMSRVIPGRVTEHHGGELSGFAGIPVRDEIQLAFELKET